MRCAWYNNTLVNEQHRNICHVRNIQCHIHLEMPHVLNLTYTLVVNGQSNITVMYEPSTATPPFEPSLKNWNCGCVCVYVRLELENRKTHLHQNWHTYSLRPRRGNGKVKTPENVSWVGVPVRAVSCSSKTKHDRRTVPRPKLFVSARRLQELRSQTQKLSWARVSAEVLGLEIIFL
jgi:hypothetical protein